MDIQAKTELAQLIGVTGRIILDAGGTPADAHEMAQSLLQVLGKPCTDRRAESYARLVHPNLEDHRK